MIENQNGENQKNKAKLWTPSYIILLGTSALTAAATQMIIPTLPKYAVGLGASLTIAGTISGIFAITALVARPFSGMAIDRLNRKRLILIATALTGLAILGYTLASSIRVLLAFRVLHGLLFSVTSAANVSFASLFIPQERMGEGIGYLGFGYIFGIAVGPNLGLSIANRVGFELCFYVAFALVMVAAGLMLFIPYKAPQEKKVQQKKVIKIKDLIALELLPLTLFGGSISLGNGLIWTFLAMMGESRNINNVGIFFFINAVMLVIIRLFSGKVYDQKGLGFILIPSYILGAVGMFLVGASTALWMIALAAILISVGQGAGQPALMAQSIKILGIERSGAATSMIYLGADIGQGIGPAIGGAVSANFGFGTMYFGCGGLLICVMVYFMIYDKYVTKRKSS